MREDELNKFATEMTGKSISDLLPCNLPEHWLYTLGHDANTFISPFAINKTETLSEESILGIKYCIDKILFERNRKDKNISLEEYQYYITDYSLEILIELAARMTINQRKISPAGSIDILTPARRKVISAIIDS